jgi:arylsulfatase
MLMLHRRNVVTLTALALGALLGYAAAMGQLSPITLWFSRPAAAAVDTASAPLSLDRTILPIAEPTLKPITELDARKAKAPPRFEVKAPPMAPNVVIVLIDDMGYGHPSTFGGAIAMPTLDRLAARGLRYTNMHVTAMCSPTRAALLTGRNHHTCNMAAVVDWATVFPGNTGVRPNSVAPLAEILRLNGYNTAAFGKWHLAPRWEINVSGPFSNWPTQSGFEKFYGFHGGYTNQWAPLLYDGLARVELPSNPNYHLMTDMTNQAITWARFQHTLTPDKPFFLYFAPGATHAPHHVPKTWSDKYRGKFDAGWDRYRQETLARQLKQRIVPAGTELAPKPRGIWDWDTLSAGAKRLFARQMEVFAGFAEYADYEIGRLVTALEDLGVMDNTLFVYIAGDNGAAGDGGLVGAFSEMTGVNGIPQTLADQLKHLDQWGGPESYPHYAAGWAVAGNTPFAWCKTVASDYGGTKNGMVIHWPRGIRARGEVRTQWHHVVDIAPTVLEAAGLPFPRLVNGTPQRPLEGVSLVYSLNDAAAKDQHLTQYFEMLGNRAIYHDGWLARTLHWVPWEADPRAALDKDEWELYDTRSDFSLANNRAGAEAARLKELQALFLSEAAKYNVLPLDDRLERFLSTKSGRPNLMGGRTSLTLYEGMTGIMEDAFLNVKNRSHTITATVDVPPGGANGVLVAQGGRFGGWSLYLKAGKPTYVYNFVGLERTTVAGKEALQVGKATITLAFTYDGGGPGRGGTATLSVNGEKVAQGRLARTTAGVFSPDEGAGVGIDEGTPVSEDYQAGAASRFSGKINKVTIELR